MHGGKDFNNAPIISFPHYPDLRNISDENFQDVILYLTSITRYFYFFGINFSFFLSNYSVRVAVFFVHLKGV